VTVSAARTGIVGGAAPLCGGMVISMEKMSKIGEPEKNEQNDEWALSVEPGALLCDISKKLSETRNPKLFADSSCRWEHFDYKARRNFF